MPRIALSAEVQAAHLGGATPGGDPATWFPELWRWLVEERGVLSVIDIGCGDGQALDFFLGLGCFAIGVEGVPQGRASIATHDFTTGPFLPPSKFDLAWCCEFVEHVEERFVPNFLATFALADLVLLTHAFPGQPGHHHVNCRPPDYWVGALAAIGYRLDDDLTAVTRAIAARNEHELNHYVRSGLAFVRQS